jgi:hypothetical protein
VSVLGNISKCQFCSKMLLIVGVTHKHDLESCDFITSCVVCVGQEIQVQSLTGDGGHFRFALTPPPATCQGPVIKHVNIPVTGVGHEADSDKAHLTAGTVHSRVSAKASYIRISYRGCQKCVLTL